MSSETEEPGPALSLEEIQAVDTVLWAALQVVDEESLVDLEVAKKVVLIRSARLKLQTIAPKGLCRHCADRERRGNTPHCKRCADYKRKYGHLPTEETLRKSAARKDRRRP